MRWPGLTIRVTGWFSEAIAMGDCAVADRFAGVAMKIRDVEAIPWTRVGRILDVLEDGELASLEVRELRSDPLPPLGELVADLEGLFEEDGICEEAGALYRFTRARGPTSW